MNDFSPPKKIHPSNEGPGLHSACENVIHRPSRVGGLVGSSELSREFSCYSENEVDRGPVESETQVNLVLCTLVES